MEELDQAKLTPLLKLKYHDSIADAVADLGKPEEIGRAFSGFQRYLYLEEMCIRDRVVEGEVEAGKRYEEPDFNKIIEIKDREKKRVDIFMSLIDQREKTLVFCATQDHALAIRDLINQAKTSIDPNYCQRVTANDGALGEQWLRCLLYTSRCV